MPSTHLLHQACNGVCAGDILTTVCACMRARARGNQGPHTGRRSDFIMLASASSTALAGLTAPAAATDEGRSVTITTHPLTVVTWQRQRQLELRCSGGQITVVVRLATAADGGGRQLKQQQQQQAVVGVGTAHCSSASELAPSPVAVVWTGATPPADAKQQAVLSFTLEAGAVLYSFAVPSVAQP
jgi:hypothetical protein